MQLKKRDFGTKLDKKNPDDLLRGALFWLTQGGDEAVQRERQRLISLGKLSAKESESDG
jgi:hypothetical protein